MSYSITVMNDYYLTAIFRSKGTTDAILVGTNQTENLYEVCGGIDDKGLSSWSMNISTTKIDGDCT